MPLSSPPILWHSFSLVDIKDQLLNDSQKNRFHCLFFYSACEDQGRCKNSCENSELDHRKLLGIAIQILKQPTEEISEEDFMSILKMLFCGNHIQTSPMFKSYEKHFKTLWSISTLHTRGEVRDAFLSCYQSLLVSNIVDSLANLEISIKPTISFDRDATPSRALRPGTPPQSSGFERTQSYPAPRNMWDDLPENENIQSILTPPTSPESRSRNAQTKLGHSIQATANPFPLAQSETFSSQNSHLGLERDGCPKICAPLSLRSSPDFNRALDQKSTTSPTTNFPGVPKSGFPMQDTDQFIRETQGEKITGLGKLPIPPKIAYAKNISISTPIPNLITENSFQESLFLSSTFSFAPPVPNFSAPQSRCGRKTCTSKSPLTSNNVDNLAARPVGGINASDTNSTTIPRPEGPDIAGLENSMLSHVSKQILIQPPLESAPSESSSSTSLTTTFSKTAVCKHTDHFAKTKLGDDGCTLSVRSKPAIVVYHKGRRLRIKLPPQSVYSTSSSERSLKTNKISTTANQLVVPVLNTIQSKTPESVHLGATSLSNQRAGEQVCTYDIHNPETIAKRIRSILLRGVEEQSGFIYVLKAPGFFQTFEPAKEKGEEWVQIGISRNVKRRIDSLKYSCGFTDLQECPGLGEGPMRMDLLHIIERVCHEEFSNFRRTIRRSEGANRARCNSMQDVWFAVPEQVAVRTIKLWKKFLNRAPYAESGKLKDDWRDRVADDPYWQPQGNEGDFDYESVNNRHSGWLDDSSKKWWEEKRENLRNL